MDRVALMGFWGRVGALIRKAFLPGDAEFMRVSRFARFLDGVERDDPEFEPGHQAAALCEESLGLVRKRLALTAELKDAEDRLNELECFNRLSDEDAGAIKNLFERHRALTKDHTELKHRVIGFSGAVAKVADLQERAPNVLRDIQDAEGAQRAFKGDVAILKGEKTSLDDEYERMGAALELTRLFTIGFVAALSLAAVVLAFAFVFSGNWVLLPAGIAAVTAIALATMIYMLKRHLQAEMKRNIALRQKAVGMLNRKSAVYAHYTNFLKVQYKKYSIRNSEMLKRNLRQYAEYKHLTKRLDSVRSILYQTEEELERVLRECEIPNGHASIELFIAAVDVDDRKAAYERARKRKAGVLEQLTDVERKQQAAWVELDGLAAVSGLAARIVMDYMAAAERAMTRRADSREKIGESEEGEGL